jgi:hypothetical protein
MITIPQLTAQALAAFLAQETKGRFVASQSGLTELLPFAARLTMECIGNSDALYHDIEHTMLVTLVGHDILVGRAMARATTADDYANFILACLTHDIGYVRGIVQGDEDDAFVADLSGRKVQLPVGSSDAALAPYHVDRSKLFVIERFDAVEGVDAARIAKAIEYTRFPYATTPTADIDDLNEEEGLLLRAADLIGQLGDPNYIRKSNALFHEFEEIGLNKKLGYATPADIVYKFPQFYWTNVAPQIQLAIRYLNVTTSGRQWIANLHGNVFRAEREVEALLQHSEVGRLARCLLPVLSSTPSENAASIVTVRSARSTMILSPGPLRQSPLRRPDRRPDILRARQTWSRRLRLVNGRKQVSPICARAHLINRCWRHEVAVLTYLPSPTERPKHRRKAERNIG